jgi:oligopeptide/dipeptide ABC transporter ATP-binding protein
MTSVAQSDTILEATDLEIDYTTRAGRVRSLDGASLRLRRGEITALIGESGSGKTTLGMAAGRLLASNALHVAGSLTLAGTPVFDCTDQELRRLRRETVGFIFQNPIAYLDPTMRIRRQLELAVPKDTMRSSHEEMLERVGLRDIARVMRAFPHELSGGMAQRVAIALVLSRRPKLLIADEPTAAVDATLRNQILSLLVEVCAEQECSLLLMTHDLHAVARYTSHIAVMYGGRVVESGESHQVLSDPRHPYTKALTSALPGEEAPGTRLEAIQGVPPVLTGPSPGCAFAPRCPQVMPLCGEARPRYDSLAGESSGKQVCCHLETFADGTTATAGYFTGQAADEASS